MTATPTSVLWHGIVFTVEERKRWLSRQERPEDTLAAILEAGLPIRDQVKRGETLCDKDAKIAKRVDQVLAAADRFGLIRILCSDQLLAAYGLTVA